MADQVAPGAESKNAQLRRRWFTRASEALHRTVPTLPAGMVICPLCMTAYRNLQKFTLEHAPPESVRGSRLVLTCGPCNRWSGRHFDPHMAVAQEFGAFARGEASRLIRLGIEGLEGEITVRATVKDGNWTVIVDEKRSNPKIAQTIQKRLEQLAMAGEIPPAFNLSWDLRYQRLPESIAWLRAGFLVAFAALGYRYILHPALNGIREQIRSPTALTLPNLGVLLLTESDSSGRKPSREIRLIKEPAELRAILVRMGRMGVLLPDLTVPADFHARIADALPRLTKEGSNLSGPSLPWPRGPRLALDFLPPK
jgi:hypothetical protein